MIVEQLKLPIWILNPSLTEVEQIYHIQNLQVLNKLTLRKTKFVDWYLYDATNSLFKVTNVIDNGNYNNFWVFEFFNPMRKIEIVIEEIKEDNIKNKIKQLIDIQTI